jgi:hypothetical protein
MNMDGHGRKKSGFQEIKLSVFIRGLDRFASASSAPVRDLNL